MKQCASCDASKDIERLPTGWKEHAGMTFCSLCWRSQYALRAVTIPIASPVGMDWTELRKMLRESFDMVTKASNWALRQLAVLDSGMDGTAKIAKMPKIEPGGKSLYLGVADRWPMDTRTAACLTQAVQATYRAFRFDMWRGSKSLPTMRYPQPIPCHNASWSVSEGADGGLIVNLPLGRKNRVDVRMRGGANYRRQLADVRRIINGEAVQGQLDILDSGTKVLLKMVGWFRKVERHSGWTAALHTGGDAFVVLYNDSAREIYRWNADHVKQRIQAQDERMQRLREDLKAEKRIGRERSGIVAKMALLREKHTDYMHSFCHETTAQIVGHLSRGRCGMLIAVTKDESYMPHFPWFKFRTMLADKANKAGIEIASGDAVSESPEPLEQTAQ